MSRASPCFLGSMCTSRTAMAVPSFLLLWLWLLTCLGYDVLHGRSSGSRRDVGTETGVSPMTAAMGMPWGQPWRAVMGESWLSAGSLLRQVLTVSPCSSCCGQPTPSFLLRSSLQFMSSERERNLPSQGALDPTWGGACPKMSFPCLGCLFTFHGLGQGPARAL